MKGIKTVNDDLQFKEASNAVERCQLELLRVAERSSAIESEILGIKEIVPADDQWNQFKAGGSIETGARSRIDALRAQQSDLQQREAFLNEALTQGRNELDKIRGRLSVEICKSYRSEFANDAKETLHHLKALTDVTERTRRRRESLEQSGIRTGSIPAVVFDLGSRWDDPHGGKVLVTRYGLRKISRRFHDDEKSCVV
jgi:hypothetical protein